MSDGTPETPTAGQDYPQRYAVTEGPYHDPEGDWIHIGDYDTLASQLAQAQQTIESVQAEYQSVVLKDGEDIKRLERELTDMEKDKHVIQHERDEYYAELEQARLKDSLRERGLDPDVTTLRVEGMVKDHRITELKEQLAQAQQLVEMAYTHVSTFGAISGAPEEIASQNAFFEAYHAIKKGASK